MSVLVHVTLRREVTEDAAAKAAALGRIQAAGLSGLNQKRFDRYGIASGLADDAAVAAIRAMGDIVSGVEPDCEKRAL